MGLFGTKSKPQKQNFTEAAEIKKEDAQTINALPDFEIRTMKDDLAGMGVRKGDKSILFRLGTQEKTAAPSSAAIPLPPKPETGEKIEEKPVKEPETEIPKKIESGMIVPENLPILQLRKKTELPSTEELIRKPEEKPFTPLPPTKQTVFEEEISEEEKAEEQREIGPREEVKEKEIPPVIEQLPQLPKMEKIKIPAPLYAPEKEGLRRVLRMVTAGIVVFALLGGGAFLFFKKQAGPETQTPATPAKVEPQFSPPLINIEQQKIVSLNQRSLLQILREEGQKEQVINSFKRINILKSESEVLSLPELLQGLEISISPYVFSEMEDQYNLLIFSQQSGKRIGLIIKIKNPENLKIQMKNWEPDMLNSFKNLYAFELPGPAASKTFLDDNYRNVIIRYKNLPYSTLTLNYTILDNLLFIGTSKETIYTAIDRILAK